MALVPAKSEASLANQPEASRLAVVIDCLMSLLGLDPAGGGPIPAGPGIITGGIAPVKTGVATASLILKAAAGVLYGINVVNGTTAGFVMIFDSATLPADGTVTPIKVIPIAASASVNFQFDSAPIKCANGIVACVSSTGPFTKTIVAAAGVFISGEVQ